MTVEVVLESVRGSIVAPAGCGKTHLISEVLRRAASRPYLVLTHTTAGVTALKKRLNRLSVPVHHYVVTTIDGWALRVARSFPRLCPLGVSPENPAQFYPSLRQSVLNLIRAGNINDVIRASYSRLLVDEYQDCNTLQHDLTDSLANILPTVVLGDPMQCIFSFSGPIPNWDQTVLTCFPLLDTLQTPWRWNKAGAPELGGWLLQCRKALLEGRPVNLNSCPTYINYRLLSGNPATDVQLQQQEYYRLMQQYAGESILVLGDSRRPRSRHQFAQHVNGIDVVEPVDLSDVVRAINSLEATENTGLVQTLLTVAGEMMTNLEISNTLQRVRSILAGRNRTAPTPLESALVVLSGNPSRQNILSALGLLESKPGIRIYRQGAFKALKDSIALAASAPDKSFMECASIIREQRRYQGDQRIPPRAIGSTLLLKGLECDHALILDAGNMQPSDLYVALTRGAKSVTVFSGTEIYQC